MKRAKEEETNSTKLPKDTNGFDFDESGGVSNEFITLSPLSDLDLRSWIQSTEACITLFTNIFAERKGACRIFIGWWAALIQGGNCYCHVNHNAI